LAYGFIFFCLFVCVAKTSAQTIEAHIRIESLTSPRARIEGRRNDATTIWSFRTTYAGLLGLGARIEGLTLDDAQGSPVAVRQLAPGEYEAARPAVSFRYEVKLDPPAADADAAHVSWLTPEQGILMLGDLLPLPTAGAKLRLTLPPVWQSVAADEPSADGRYELAQAESSVLLVGPAIRLRAARAGALPFKLATVGAWAFTDDDLAHVVAEILAEYGRVTGDVPRRSALVLVAPFPRAVLPHVWSAETRGGTVLLLTGHTPSKNAALAQLSAPLTHELFHLWVPNALPLKGDYDWFFEGFTLYEAARASVRLGQVNFQNYLDNLALAYERSRSDRAAANLSLLDAAKRRWSDPTAAVYYRGMLAAYLYDLNVRLQTGGKRSLEDVYRALFRRSSKGGRANDDANAVVLEIMNSVAGGPTLTRSLIEQSNAVDLAAAVQPFGLQVVMEGAHTRVVVAPQLSRAQRDLLKQIGYNESAGHGHR
jgi:predicted metalloprotease with PDZ domain